MVICFPTLIRKKTCTTLKIVLIMQPSEWHQTMKTIANPIDFCAVLPDNRRTFDWFQSFVVALAKSQDRRVIYGVFCFLADRQGALANGLHGLNPRNTDNRTHPLHCRSALVKRLIKHLVQRWKQGQMYKRINPSSALGCSCF